MHEATTHKSSCYGNQGSSASDIRRCDSVIFFDNMLFYAVSIVKISFFILLSEGISFPAKGEATFHFSFNYYYHFLSDLQNPLMVIFG